MSTETIHLPSKGLLYPESHPLHDKETIDIRLLTASDEDLLSSKSAIKSGQLVNILCKNVLIDKTIDIDSLFIGDRNSILIYTRLLSFGTDYKANVICKHCQTQGEYNFDLTNIPVKYLEVSPISPYTNLFEFTTSTNTKFTFKLLTVAIAKLIEKDLESVEKFYKKQGNYNFIESNITTMYRHIITAINDNDDISFINKYIAEMPIKESIEFKKYIKNTSPTIEFKSSFYCLNCGENNEEVNLDFNSNFFWDDF